MIDCLHPGLLEQVLSRLGVAEAPAPDLDGLRTLYRAWCRRMPWDNVQKLVFLAEQRPGPMPGADPEDFFGTWLRHGTGGTCWATTGGLHALLCSLGFPARRLTATMLPVPDLTERNHGTNAVHIDGVDYLCDTSMLTLEPVPLAAGAYGSGFNAVRVVDEGSWHVLFRHNPEGEMPCRIDSGPGITTAEFLDRLERTRTWSPFNDRLVGRVHRPGAVVLLRGDVKQTIGDDGLVVEEPLSVDRDRVLIEELGMSEEIVSRLPAGR